MHLCLAPSTPTMHTHTPGSSRQFDVFGRSKEKRSLPEAPATAPPSRRTGARTTLPPPQRLLAQPTSVVEATRSSVSTATRSPVPAASRKATQPQRSSSAHAHAASPTPGMALPPPPRRPDAPPHPSPYSQPCTICPLLHRLPPPNSFRHTPRPSTHLIKTSSATAGTGRSSRPPPPPQGGYSAGSHRGHRR